MVVIQLKLTDNAIIITVGTAIEKMINNTRYKYS